jgi:hypothetical protein
MPISQLVGEGVNGKHMHSYQDSNTGYWEWCNDCQCMVTNPCLHNEYICCYERSTYIRLKRKYEAVEHGVPTIESGGKKPAKKSKRKGSAPAKSG